MLNWGRFNTIDWCPIAILTILLRYAACYCEEGSFPVNYSTCCHSRLILFASSPVDLITMWKEPKWLQWKTFANNRAVWKQNLNQIGILRKTILKFSETFPIFRINIFECKLELDGNQLTQKQSSLNVTRSLSVCAKFSPDWQ